VLSGPPRRRGWRSTRHSPSFCASSSGTASGIARTGATPKNTSRPRARSPGARRLRGGRRAGADARMPLVVEAIGGTPVAERRIEVVERKGVGHPDTICDLAVEAASVSATSARWSRASWRACRHSAPSSSGASTRSADGNYWAYCLQHYGLSETRLKHRHTDRRVSTMPGPKPSRSKKAGRGRRRSGPSLPVCAAGRRARARPTGRGPRCTNPPTSRMCSPGDAAHHAEAQVVSACRLGAVPLAPSRCCSWAARRAR
jgi:hypothetical protein